MFRTTMHEFLAKGSADFAIELFERQGFRQLASKTLNRAERWEQRKCPLSALFVIWTVIALTLHRAKSYPNVLTAMLGLIRETEPRLSLRGIQPNSLCHARTRLGYEPMEDLFHRHARRIDPKPSFLGLRTWGIDGVHFTMPDTPLNDWAFGRPGTARGSAAFPQLLAVALVDTQSHRVRDVVFTDCRDGEGSGCAQVVQGLRKDDLIFVDRGLSSAKLFDQCWNAGIHFVGRISTSWKPIHVKWLNKNRGDSLVRLEVVVRAGRRTGTQRTIKLTLRMIEFEIKAGKPVRLLTDLLDPVKYPARVLALGYHERWESEITYDELKTHLATVTHGTLHTVLRSKTPEGILQEAYGMMIAYNLVREVIAEAATAHAFPAREVSFVEALDVIREALPRFNRVALVGTPRRERLRLVNQLLRDIAAVRLDRPRRKRVYDRVVKQKMSSSYLLKRPQHGQQIRDFQRELRLGRKIAPDRALRC